jgi:hypothetical protein
MADMPEFQDDLIFRVDFNNVHADGRLIKGSLPHASHPRIPAEGERVFLRDWEGNQCWAWIDQIRGAIVYFEIDYATWVAGDDLQAEGMVLAAPVASVAG